MRKNEPDPKKRVACPIPFFDNNGQLAVGLTFNTGAGEVFTFRFISNDWVAAANNATELGASGTFKVQLEQSETNYDTLLGVKLVKAGYDTQYFWIPVDNTPDVNVVSGALITDLQASVDLLLGLHRRNSLLDGGSGFPSIQYDANSIMLVGRLRVFTNAAALAAAVAGAADNANAEIARYRITGVASAGKLASMRMVAELEP